MNLSYQIKKRLNERQIGMEFFSSYWFLSQYVYKNWSCDSPLVSYTNKYEYIKETL